MSISLSDVIGAVESSGNPMSVRFEPAVFARYKAVDDQAPGPTSAKIRQFEQIHRCTPDTARALLSMSYGEFQMMGFNLNENVFEFQGNTSVQVEKLSIFCHSLGVTDAQFTDASWLMSDESGDGLRFAARYNGPGDPDGYLARLRAAFVAAGRQS